MARPLRIQYPGAYYHVTCRGNDRRSIYRDDFDRELFLEKLKGSLDIYGVIVHAYVLMSNHFHLIVQTPKANLSEFMRHFNIGYTGAFNHRHKRVGHLYQGRYKAILVEKDSYLAELSRYVHLNPIRINPYKGKSATEQWRILERYPWSTFRGYLGVSWRKPWVNYDEVLAQTGGSSRKYREFLQDGISQGYATPWEKLKGQVVLANDEFVAKLSKSLGRRGSLREQPSAKAIEKLTAEQVLRTVSRYLKIKPEELTRRRTPFRDYRAMAMELMYQYSRMTQREIGQRLGKLDYSAVSRERKRFRERSQGEHSLEESMEEIGRILSQR